jgi:preprotein translocase subunit YajC
LTGIYIWRKNMMTSLLILATGGMFGGGDGQGQNPIMLIVWVAIMIALFYFMMIRPQQRKEKERRNLIANIKTGDRVIFGGGLVGSVANVKEKVFVIKIADNTKVEVVKGAVTRVLLKEDDLGTE